ARAVRTTARRSAFPGGPVATLVLLVGVAFASALGGALAPLLLRAGIVFDAFSKAAAGGAQVGKNRSAGKTQPPVEVVIGLRGQGNALVGRLGVRRCDIRSFYLRCLLLIHMPVYHVNYFV
ncbi:MAG: hypothetical protein ABJL67_10660, partial [Sulfitobacter sp.]